MSERLTDEQIAIIGERDLGLPEFHAMQLAIVATLRANRERIAELERQVAIERDASDRLAGLADTVAGALRNTNMGGADEIGLGTDLREHVWLLSYKANEYRAERDAALAAKEAAERELAEVKARNVTAGERIAKLDCALLDMRRELAEAREDAERLLWLVRDSGIDQIRDTDLHAEASIYASVFAREEANDDDYIAAIRTGVDAARAAQMDTEADK